MSKHIDALTGLRAVAVLLVFFGHLQQRYFPIPELAGNPILDAAYLGMTTFFVLSGFVIHWNYAALFEQQPARRAWRDFFAARFSRLWPLHFAVVLLAIYLAPDMTKFALHVPMIQTWAYYGSFNISYFNTWSISTEWFFYFAYAAGYPVIARALHSGSLWLLPAAFALAFSAYWFAGPVQTEADMWLRYTAPYLRLLEFLTGVVAAQIVITRRQLNEGTPTDWLLLVTAIATVLLHGSVLGQRTGINYLVAPFVAVTMIVASNPSTFAACALSPRWLLWIGDRSYSIYLLEAVYMSQCYRLETPLGYAYAPQRSWQDMPTGFLMSMLAVAIIFAAADLCWRFFEMPARKTIRSLLAPRAPAAAAM